mgnify:CR=1 FL=1
MPSHASRQAPGDPGRQKMKVAPATPAVARLYIDVPILAWSACEMRWKTVHPLFEQRLDGLRRHVAAGETGTAGGDDRVNAWIGNPALDDHADDVHVVDDDLARRRLWPAVVSRSASVAQDLSSSSVRVSEIVSTAMLSGTN